MCQLYNHYVIIYSDYNEGRRIGYHIKDTKNKIQEVTAAINKLKKEDPKLNFGLHFLQTESETWASVVESDSFFKDIYIAETLKELKKMIKKSLIIDNDDILKIYEWDKLRKEKKDNIDKEKIIDYSINSSSYFKNDKSIPIILKLVEETIKKKEKKDDKEIKLNDIFLEKYFKNNLRSNSFKDELEIFLKNIEKFELDKKLTLSENKEK